MASIKGSALLPAVKLIRKFRDKSERHLGDRGRKLAEQRILVGAWYPLEDATEVMVAAIKAIGSANIAQGMEFIGADLAENDLRGIYAHFITEGDIPKSLRRSALLWRNYFDEGTLTLEHPDSGASRVIARLEGFTASIPYCNGIVGMGKVVVRMAGRGAASEVIETKCTLKGDVNCEFDHRWA